MTKKFEMSVKVSIPLTVVIEFAGSQVHVVKAEMKGTYYKLDTLPTESMLQALDQIVAEAHDRDRAEREALEAAGGDPLERAV